MTASDYPPRHKSTAPPPQSAAGKARLADALRENLRRRKAQERARSDTGAADAVDKSPGEDGGETR